MCPVLLHLLHLISYVVHHMIRAATPVALALDERESFLFCVGPIYNNKNTLDIG